MADTPADAAAGGAPEAAPRGPRTVLITGSSSGFGRGMVDEFLARGWRVLASLRNAEDRQDLFAEALEAHPDRLELVSLDVIDPWERSATMEAVAKVGRLDCLVNNAGYGLFGALEDLTEEQLRRQFEVNFFGAALLTRACLPALRRTKGSVAFVSSAFGFQGFPLTSAYCASKFALEGLAESLFFELEPHGVRVTMVEPGANKTGFGSAVQWGERDSEPYRLQTENYRQLKAKIGERATDETPRVARRIADFAEGRSNRLRTRIGKDAALGHLFRKLTPDNVRLPLSQFFYRRMFTKERP